MKNIQLLDCTLRDGGYINDWEFGNHQLINIYERLVQANVDIIEIGFLDDRRPFDINRSIMPDTTSVSMIYSHIKKKAPMTVGMIDYGTCSISHLQPCSESFIDGIRVIFKEHFMHEALEFCAQVKALGYKVFAQLVSVTSYTDESLMELIQLVNKVKPYAVSMVDTYGLLYPETLLHIYKILDDNVDPEIQIGFHAHNNLQLAHANSLAFLDYEGKHDIVIDATLYGMGKSAGNAPIELVSHYLNTKYDKKYDTNIFLEAIQESILPIYKNSPWDYKLFFYMASVNCCHPNYVKYFEEHNTFSIGSLNQLLGTIEPDNAKLLYDQAVAEQMYKNYTSHHFNTEMYNSLLEEIGKRKVLVIGPGRNIGLQKALIMDYIAKTQPFTISVNYTPENIESDYVFVTNTKRYSCLSLTSKQIIATSNIKSRHEDFKYIVNREPLLDTSADIPDNSFLMLIKFLKNIGINQINCAGFDGYSENTGNYFNPDMEYDFVCQKATSLNEYMRKEIKKLRQNMDIKFITYSTYDEDENILNATI